MENSAHPHRCILLVEDHADTLRVMEKWLLRCGYEVRAATSVTDAKGCADGRRVDLLITDIGLPDGTGLELLSHLKNLGPVAGIAISGFGAMADIKASENAGFAQHLVKPFDLQTLERAVLQAFSDGCGGDGPRVVATANPGPRIPGI